MWLLSYHYQEDGEKMISPVDLWVGERTGLLNNLNTETLRLWQLKKLNCQLEHMRENSKFYRDKLKDVIKYDDLPFTCPSDIANDPFAFLCVPQRDIARVTTLSTSGTTGSKKRIFFTNNDLERTIDFFAYGMKTLMCADEHAAILMSNDTENSMGRLLKEGLLRIGVTSQILSDIKSVDDALEASRNADCLIGLPSEIFYMSRIKKDLRPNSVLLSADYVPKCVIDSIRETWKCSVFSHYGSTEFGFGCAVQCGCFEGHHLRLADLIFEVVHPETLLPVKAGECGEIVITTLNKEAMPLIRYRTGDLARMIIEPCNCGGMLPRLGRVEGRRDNDINIGNDQTVSIHKLDEIIFAIPTVRSFYATLKNKTLHLTIDSVDSLNQTFLKSNLPSELQIEIAYTKVDPFMKRGKRCISLN